MSVEATRLAKEDFPQQSEWIDRLLRPLNSFMARVAIALNSAVQDGESLQYNTIVLNTGATVTDSFPLYVRVSMTKRPRSVLVAQIEDLTAGATFTTPVCPTWILADRDGSAVVNIRHLTGLAINTQYRVTLEMKG